MTLSTAEQHVRKQRTSIQIDNDRLKNTIIPLLDMDEVVVTYVLARYVDGIPRGAFKTKPSGVLSVTDKRILYVDYATVISVPHDRPAEAHTRWPLLGVAIVINGPDRMEFDQLKGGWREVRDTINRFQRQQ